VGQVQRLASGHGFTGRKRNPVSPEKVSQMFLKKLHKCCRGKKARRSERSEEPLYLSWPLLLFVPRPLHQLSLLLRGTASQTYTNSVCLRARIKRPRRNPVSAGWPTSKFGCPIFATASSSLRWAIARSAIRFRQQIYPWQPAAANLNQIGHSENIPNGRLDSGCPLRPWRWGREVRLSVVHRRALGHVVLLLAPPAGRAGERLTAGSDSSP
jgi:hypothetical protein